MRSSKASVSEAASKFIRNEITRRILGILGHNLAVVGALCASFKFGAKYADDLWAWDPTIDRPEDLWSPGCGRPINLKGT